MPGWHEPGRGSQASCCAMRFIIRSRGILLWSGSGRSRPGVAPYDPKSMRKALATARKRFLISLLQHSMTGLNTWTNLSSCQYPNAVSISGGKWRRYRRLASSPCVGKGLSGMVAFQSSTALEIFFFDNSLSDVAQLSLTFSG